MKSHIKNGPDLLLYFAFAVLLGCCSIWLLTHNFSNDLALLRWAKVLGIMDADESRLEHLRLIYPHAPYYLLLPFTFLSDLREGMAPYLLSAMVIALLLLLWYQQLRKRGLPRAQRLILLALILTQPTLLWAGTNGGHTAISMIMFYLLYRSVMRMIYTEDVQSFILFGMVLAVYFFADPITLFIFIALLPFISIIAPSRILASSPISVYIITGIPLAIAMLSWVYLNWIFEGDAFSFINSPESAFLGGWQNIPSSEWLRQYGGEFLAPLIASASQIFILFPVIIAIFAFATHHWVHMRASLVLLLHPAIAVAFATSKFYLFYPLEILALVCTGVMAELAIVSYNRKRVFPIIAIMLLASSISGWHYFSKSMEPDIRNWYQAFTGAHIPDQYPEQRQLGEWLAQHPGDTLIDERSGFRVITVRRDATNIFTPITDRYKLETRHRSPSVQYLVVSDPETRDGSLDRLNLRYPELYRNGIPGYERVYNNKGWRVYENRS